MAYELSFEPPFELEPALRTLLGVDDIELPDDSIMSPMVAGAAEIELLKKLPTAATMLEDDLTTDLDKTRIGLAFVNYMAYYVYPSLKVRVLQQETDNKSIAQRFKDALTRDRAEFLADGDIYVDQIGSVYDGSTTQLEFVSPAIDIITGV